MALPLLVRLRIWAWCFDGEVLHHEAERPLSAQNVLFQDGRDAATPRFAAGFEAEALKIRLAVVLQLRDICHVLKIFHGKLTYAAGLATVVEAVGVANFEGLHALSFEDHRKEKCSDLQGIIPSTAVIDSAQGEEARLVLINTPSQQDSSLSIHEHRLKLTDDQRPSNIISMADLLNIDRL